MQNFYDVTGIKPKEVEFQYDSVTFKMMPIPATVSDEIRHMAKNEARKQLSEQRAELESQPAELDAYTKQVTAWVELPENEGKESTEENLEKAGIIKPKNLYDQVYISTMQLIFGACGVSFCMRNVDGVPFCKTAKEALEFSKTLPRDFITPAIAAFNKANEDAAKNVSTSALPVLSEEKIPA